MKIQKVYLPVNVENASGNYIPDNSVLIVKEQGEMDKYWEDLVKPQEGYFFTSEELDKYKADVIEAAMTDSINMQKSSNAGFISKIKELENNIKMLQRNLANR